MQEAKDLEATGRLVVPKSNGVVAQTPLPEASVSKRDDISVQATGELVVPKSNGVVAQTSLPEADKGMVKTTPPEPNGVVAQTPQPEAEKPVVQIPYQILVNSVSMPAGNPVWGTDNQGAAAPWQGHGGGSSPNPLSSTRFEISTCFRNSGCTVEANFPGLPCSF